MDSGQLDALRTIVRQAVAADLDELSTRLDQLEREQHQRQGEDDLRARLVAVERQAGLTPGPLGRTDRRSRVADLHDAGLSDRLIAVVVGANRATIARDRRALGLPHAAADAVGLDGMRLGDRSRNGHRTNGHAG